MKNRGTRTPQNLLTPPQGIETSIFQKNFFALDFCANLSPVNHIGTCFFKKSEKSAHPAVYPTTVYVSNNCDDRGRFFKNQMGKRP